MVLSMMGTGRMISRMVLELRPGQMALSTRVSMWRGRRMGRVNTSGLMGVAMRVNGRATRSVVMVYMFGWMVVR